MCGSCEAWAAALVEPVEDAETAPPEEDAAVEVSAPVALAKAVSAERPGTSRRHLMLVAAGVACVAVTGFAISVRGGSAPAAAAPTVAPAAERTPSPPAATAPPAAPSVQTWSTENRATWLGNRRRGAAFDLESENTFKTWFGPARALLVVRCTPEELDAFVVTRSPMKIEPRVEGKSVTISVDGEPLRTEQWLDSDDRTAVFAPDPAAFVERLRKARSLSFGFSPHNASDVVAQFSVAGIDALLGGSKQCGASRQR